MATLIEKAEDINLKKNNEVDQILGRPPSWILRWGITFLFIALLIFVALAWLIKYPDVLTSQVTVSTESPAIRVVADANSEIKQLRVKNNQYVKKDEIIAILNSTAEYKDIETLQAFLDKLGSYRRPSDFSRTRPLENLQLGSLQISYAALTDKLKEYGYFSGRTGVFGKIESLLAQINSTEDLIDNLKRQQKTLAEELALAQKNYTRQVELEAEGLVSKIVLEKSQTEFLRYKRELENISTLIINNTITKEQIRTDIIDLREGRQVGNSDRQLDIIEDVERLKNEILNWKQSYLIKAPIAGNISFSKVWSEQQFVKANEEVFVVVPPGGVGEIVAKAYLPIQNSGKVSKGQVIKVRLDGYNYQEYGVVEALVKDISLVPTSFADINGEFYVLEVDLPNGLTTTYDKLIPFRQEMRGVGIITTKERRILVRIFDKLYSAVKN